MEKSNFEVIPEEFIGKTVEAMSVNRIAVVIKFTDGTFLDVYLNQDGQTLITSTNKL